MSNNKLGLVLLACLLILSRHEPVMADDSHEVDGLLTRAKSHYEATEYKEALRLAEMALGLSRSQPEGLSAAELHELLGDIQEELGNYPESSLQYERTLELRIKLQGREHPDVANTLSSWAELKTVMGLFDEAEQMYRQALLILEDSKNRHHSKLLSSLLANMSVFYKNTGDFEKSLAVNLRALAIRKLDLGEEHPDCAVVMDNIGVLYIRWKKPGEARSWIERALSIFKKKYGLDHIDTIKSIHNLARYYRDIGNIDEAIVLEEQALAGFKRKYGEDHPEVANALNNLANLHRMQGDYPKAEAELSAALQIRERALGSSHPETMLALDDLAAVRMARSGAAPAVSLLQRSLSLSESLLGRVQRVAAATAINSFLGSLREQAQQIYTLAERWPVASDSSAGHLGLAAAILRKGRSLDVAADTSKAILESLNPAGRVKYHQLVSRRSQLTALLLRGLDGLTHESYQEQVGSLERETDELTRELSEQSLRFREAQRQLHPETVIKEVAARMSAESALLEVVHYSPYRFEARAQEPRWGAPRYLAMVLLPNREPTLQLIPLGEAADVDGAIREYLQAVSRPPVSGCGGSRIEELARVAYKKVMAPVERALAGRRQVFLSLDGDMQLLPFAALRDDQGYLLGRYRFTYLNSARDLLRHAGPKEPRSSVLVFADPDLDHLPAGALLPPAEAARPVLSAHLATGAARLACMDQLDPLPASREEAALIKGFLPAARLLLGSSASEPNFLGAAAPGILHVAGHTVILDEAESCPQPRAARRGLQISTTNAALSPLLKIGLVLSGARAMRRLLPDPAGSRSEDGIITGIEVASMDLWGTQLVVLSTCESGRGVVVPGEGVFGLRRAFMIAGAQTLVSSLWKVQDNVARDLIGTYYEHLLRGEDRVAAMDRAALAMKERFAEPYYWAPFIVIGQSGKLQGFSLTVGTATRPNSASQWRVWAVLAALGAGLVALRLYRRSRQSV